MLHNLHILTLLFKLFVNKLLIFWFCFDRELYGLSPAAKLEEGEDPSQGSLDNAIDI